MKRTSHFNIHSIIFTILCFSQQCYIIQAQYSFNDVSTLYKGVPVLVTGGCGFIGSHVAEKLVELGAEVTILDNLSTGSLENIASVDNKITFIKGDIRDFNTCLIATENKKIIFHLAAFVSVPASTTDPQECHRINVIGTQNLLEAARINNVTRFVFSSTCAVYGESITPCDETKKPAPTSPYGFSKLIGELYCQEYAQLFNLETVSMRYFNVYGPRQDPQSSYSGVISKFIYNIEHNLPLTIFGDGTQTRDYVPVEKVAEANIVLGISPINLVTNQIFNIATEKIRDLFELIEMLKEKYPFYNNEILFMPARPGDVKHIAADCSKYNNLYNQRLNQSKPKVE